MFSQNIGAMYDSWLLQQADEYMSSGCEGEPQIVGAEQEFEGYDDEGGMLTSTSYTYSCEECEEKDCEHWKEFHEKEYEEYLKELEENKDE